MMSDGATYHASTSKETGGQFSELVVESDANTVAAAATKNNISNAPGET